MTPVAAINMGPAGVIAAFALAALVGLTGQGAEAQEGNMRIRIKAGDAVITVTLDDNPTALDFASLLPLTVRLRDYNGTEKISDLPRPLSRQDAPAGHDPSSGEITYYAPWGNLAIFYRDFGYSTGLIRLGRIDGDIEALQAPELPDATIEAVE